MRLPAWALALGILVPLSGPVLAQDAGAASGGSSGGSGSSQDCGNEAFAKKLAGRESGGNQKIVNAQGYMGSYQMGEAALIDAGYASRNGSAYDNANIAWTGKDGINSTQDFLNNQQAQTNAFNANLSNNWRRAERNGLTQYVGRDINGVTLTESGLLGGMHLKPAAVKAYFNNGGCIPGRGSATNDGNGTCVGEYMKKFSGFDVSSITGKNGQSGSCNNPGDSKDDKASKGESGVCKVHVPMVQAIDCSKYVSSLQAFCFETKPKVMTMAECESAEKYAKGAPKGKREKECKDQTFNKGTGSWSYVLACSGTPTDQGEKGKDNKDNAKGENGSEKGTTGQKDGTKEGNVTNRPATDGSSHKVNNAESWAGKSAVSSYNNSSTQCVALVQQDNGMNTGVGHTSTWAPGDQVVGNNIEQGTVIGTFNGDGRYTNTPGQSHVAIYMGQRDDGAIRVIDQWAGSGTVRDRWIMPGSGAQSANNFYVVSHRR